MTLQSILEEYAGIVMDRQFFLGGLLGDHRWEVDLESGMFFFDGPDTRTPFEILGTFSHLSQEWLWSWANTYIPEQLTQTAFKLGDLGGKEGIDIFMQRGFASKEEDLHVLGVAACGLGGAKAYYIADYGDGALLAVFPQGEFMDGWEPDPARVFMVFPQVLQTFDLDHKKALVHYLTALGYRVHHEENDLIASFGENSLRATFDTKGRLTGLDGGLRA